MDLTTRSSPLLKILFLADTHLGFDLPFKPRIERRRRGEDFFNNFRRALEPAINGRVDAVVHGGDLLYRSKVPAHLVDMAFQPLKEVADKGVPIYLVPGNHERSAIPYRLLATHPNIHIFHKPLTYTLQVHGITLALVGFPYVRENIRENFSRVLAETAYQSQQADINLLCMHHCVEGSAVRSGGRMFVFRNQDFVIKAADIPTNFAAVLSGHIHRFQVLTKETAKRRTGRPLAVPVFYPGSIERTSFAEKDEAKGYLVLETRAAGPGGKVTSWTFHELPARPMVERRLELTGKTGMEVKQHLTKILAALPADSIVKIIAHGQINEEISSQLTAAALRRLALPTMNISLVVKSP